MESLTRSELQLVSRLEDDNINDSSYFTNIFFHDLKKEGISAMLVLDDVKTEPNPNGKTIGEIHGLKTIYSIHLTGWGKKEVTQKYDLISMAILEAYRKAFTMLPS